MSSDDRPRVPARPSISSAAHSTVAPAHIAMASMASKPRAEDVPAAAVPSALNGHGNGYGLPLGVGVSSSSVGYTQYSQAELSSLWEAVGLEVNGVHNYDPRCLELERIELEALHDEFLAHRKLFGFQADNVRNQMEHICFLIQNARDRYGAAAYQYLHNRFFSNYRKWCAHINAQRWCFQKRMKHSFDSPSYGDRNKIQDLVLWLLIWGEAANLRHCPEYLCFVFYRMSAERQRVIDSGVIDRDHFEDEWFRCHVIQPAYNIAFAMQQYVRNNGSLKDHPKRPNYDDLNEYFWNRRWLDHNKSYHDEDVEKFWGNKYNRGFLIDLDPKTGKVVVQKEGNKADRKRKDAARVTLKTFPEKRSWLNLFRSFFRIVELHAFAFHILILFGYGYAQAQDYHVIGTAVLTPAALAVLLEIVEFGFYYGVIYSQGLFLNFLLRLVVYSAVFIVLFGLFYLDYEYFFWIAVAYMALRVFWELVNVTTHRWIRKWHMSEDRNFESDVATQLGWWRRVGSTIFWIAIFMLKCFYSYFTYIKPIITITDTLLNIKGWVGAAGVGPDNDASTSNWLLVVLLWLPTLIMFAIDTQIFFSTCIVFIGVILGVRDRVCNVRSWDDIEKGFTYSWRNGARKFFGGRDELRSVAVEAASAHKGVLNLPPLIQPPWHLIQVMWKEIILEMRAADHTSYHDDQLLQFGHFTYQNEHKQVQETFFMPPFVTAGQVGNFVEMLGELQDAKDRRLGGMSMILREIKQQLKTNETMRIALDEVYTAGTLLLQTFIPQGSVHFSLSEGNKLLEYTCRQKKPYSFLKDVCKSLENATTECIALCFDKGHQNIIRKRPTTASIASMQEETFYGQQPVGPEQLNTRNAENAITALYKFWVMIAEGAGAGADKGKDGAAAGAAIASSVAPPKVVFSVVDNLLQNELSSLLRTIFHLLSTPMMDARPSSRTVADRLMFFLSSLNTNMPERQNSIKEMYSWTVLTPYVEELVIYTPEELETPNVEGITADFYLKTCHKREWMNFLERLAADPMGADPSYRLVQKREWCSFRGQTLLRTVRGMLYYERAIKILSLLELARGSHWSPAQERVAKAIAQRKFQYVLSCQKYGAFKNARARRDRGELIDKSNLPDSVRLERKKLLDEAQKADDIEYILRKYPHLRIAYVDDRTVAGERQFASVLVKALVREDGRAMPAAVVMGAAGKPDPLRHEDVAGGNLGSASNAAVDPRNRGMGGQEVGSGAMLEDPELRKADDHGQPAHKPFMDVSPDVRLGAKGGGADGSDIQEIYRIRLPGNVLIGEGKPENQNHAMIFTRGEFLEAIDMNQDNYLEEAFKFRNLLEEFDPLRAPDVKAHRDELARPNPVNNGANGVRASSNGVLKCAILGFRENIFTANLMSVGTYMSLMEATFVSITLRTFAWLGSRFHYGHPDALDKIFFITRGGMSKASKMIHVSEDIFAGFKSTLRGGRILHKEYVQVGKGRDLGFNQLFLFEAKLASGAGEQALSRECNRLGRYLDLPRLLSVFYGSVGFYATTAMIVVAIGGLLFARMMLALTGIDHNVKEFNDQFGVSVGLLQASSIYQLGLLLILPMLAEIALEKTLVKALTTFLWMLMTGASFFFFFHLQTKAFFFNNSVMYGGAKYRATGRGFVLSRDSFTRIYRTYARSHIYPAIKLLFMMTVFGIFNGSGTNWFVEMWAPLLLVIAWLYSPMWFNPMAFDHDKVMQDFHEWRRWLDRKAQNEETSWQGWWVMETEYMTRTPRSTKLWLTVFNLAIPILIVAACIASLETTDVSRVYFLLISVGGTVGLVLVGLFLVYQFHPVGDTYRWMKFFLGFLVLALLVVTIIFDTGSTSFGWKGTNFAVYLIVIALTFNTICKVLMIHGAGPYRFGFCLTWFKYCDTIFGLIVYAPWLIFSFVGLAAIQTRLLYNRAFFRGLRVSELLQQDPNKRDKFRSRPALTSRSRAPVVPLSASHAAQEQNGKGGNGGGNGGFTPLALTRENSMDDLRAAGMKPRTGLQTQVGEHSYAHRSKNYYAQDGGPSLPGSGYNSPNRSHNSSRRNSADDGFVSPEMRGRLIPPGAGRNVIDGRLAPPNGNLLIYSQSPSASAVAGPASSGPLSSRATVAAGRDDDEKAAAGGAAAQPRYTYA